MNIRSTIYRNCEWNIRTGILSITRFRKFLSYICKRRLIQNVCDMSSKLIRVRLVFGLLALGIGLVACNLALFNWAERTDIQYIFGAYARYVCAYGGFSSIILGSMLVNESVPRNIETHRIPFNTGSFLVMSSDWRIFDHKMQAIGIGDGLRNREPHIKARELREEESKNELGWRREEHHVRGNSRSAFRDSRTGRFIKNPEYQLALENAQLALERARSYLDTLD